jgi:enediyne biosynthesis protein E4
MTKHPLFILTTLLFCCCKQKPVEATLFKRLDAVQTGVTFRNDITESEALDVLKFEYIYNGGGVGVADLNKDGYTDIFFAGNMVSSQLYLNKGGLAFQNITEAAGVGTKAWCTGVAIADVDNNGWSDIYVSTVVPFIRDSVANLLFLNKGADNQGIPHFEEVAAKVGLNSFAYATQAAFLDYDRDNDLDIFLLNNALEPYNRNYLVGQKHNGTGRSLDQLFRNDGPGPDGLPHFTDVSRAAGINSEGWGLGVAVSDINLDGWPDIYAANDFQSNDQLYLNNQKGGFTNEITRYFKHTCHNSMGIDIADIDNDQLVDIGVVDMLPDDNVRQKTMFAGTGYHRFLESLAKGYQPQYIRNVLQHNNGNGTFSDIGYMAGIQATDWSWSMLMADFDNDGWRDILITNGYRKDITNLDFIAYNNDKKLFNQEPGLSDQLQKELGAMLGVKKANFSFRNRGDLTFEDASKAWGLADSSYSNGTAYADFDNDGDLDLVMNNINDAAFIYENQTIVKGKVPTNHYIRLRFDEPINQGYGTKCWAYADSDIYYAEYYPQKGYKSTQETFLHLGLGAHNRLDSLRISWADGRSQILTSLPVDQVLTLKRTDATAKRPVATAQQQWTKKPVFEDITTQFDYLHEERDFPDFNYQVLLPHKHSESGPRLATGDVDGNRLGDFVVGGSAEQSACIFMQQPNGRFKKTLLPAKPYEDVGLLLFDADGDRDLDLYCVSGSSEFLRRPGAFQDRLYRNNGRGVFQVDTTALPVIDTPGSCVVAADYDADGDQDLFVGGRVVPTRYPEAPTSYLLQNDGKGHFTSVAPPELVKIGMVTAAQWADIDRDGDPDLALVGEFMPLTIFTNNKGQLTRSNSPALANTTGWYNSLQVDDLDSDGDMDFVVGNLGLNSRYKASPEQPVCVYAKDYDQNGSIDPILCLYIQGKEYCTHPRDNLTEQIPGLKKIINRYALYGQKTYTEIFSPALRENVTTLQAKTFANAVILNEGNNNWTVRPLPIAAQTAPMQAIAIEDVNRDGHKDLITVGNSYSTEALTGRYDAGIGTILLGDGKGNFSFWPNRQHCFVVDGDARDMALVKGPKTNKYVIATQNRGTLKVFKFN